MNSGHYGFPNILGLVRATAFKVLGKAGATNGAALAGGTASGAPTAPAGPFDVGDVIVDATGKLWICSTAGTSQSSPGSFTQVGGTASPLTTKGDVWVYGSTDARLGVGSNDSVLIADSTQSLGVRWGAAPAGAGGALTQLAVLSGASATYDFTSISGSYNALRLSGLLRLDAATTDNYLLVTFNGDGTAAHYASQYMDPGNGAANVGATVAVAGLRLGDVCGASAPANQYSPFTLDIPLYSNTATYKGALGWSFYQGGTLGTTMQYFTGGGCWLSTAAISEVTLVPASGAWTANSKVILYGLS